MDQNTITALVGAGISAGIYVVTKLLKYYYKHYYLKSECHGSNELVISIEAKDDQPNQPLEKAEPQNHPDQPLEKAKPQPLEKAEPQIIIITN
jgi:hypothetical protein